MTVETAIYNILRGDSAVVALCPQTRIKVPGNWQNLARPYIIHFPVTIDPIRTHDGLAALNIWDYYQVSVVADTYSQGRTLVAAVIAALDGQHPGLDIQHKGGTFYIGRNSAFDAEEFAINFQVAEALTSSPL